MRLVRLEITGFGAFRDSTDLDFTDADFFALVGPTGSGKSTVIDAVCFALYGSVPRYEDQRINRYVVTLGASEARVSLTFELEVSYVATRVVRRSATRSSLDQGGSSRATSGKRTKHSRCRHGAGDQPRHRVSAPPRFRGFHAMRGFATGRVRPLPACQG